MAAIKKQSSNLCKLIHKVKMISDRNKILISFVFISVYVLLAKVFEHLKIPYSFLSEKSTSELNEVLYSLAVSYLMGVFVYFVTVILFNMRERKNRKWEIYDLFQSFKQHINDYLDEKIEGDFPKVVTSLIDSLHTNRCIEHCSEYTTPGELRLNFERLKSIYDSIRELNNRIIVEIQK